MAPYPLYPSRHAIRLMLSLPGWSLIVSTVDGPDTRSVPNARLQRSPRISVLHAAGWWAISCKATIKGGRHDR